MSEDDPQEPSELSPSLEARIRSTVRRLARPAGLERVIRELRREHGIPDDDAARGAREAAELLALSATARHDALLVRPELARPAVVLALYDRTRTAIAAGSDEAPELARLGIAVTSRFSGERYAASAILDRLGEGWLLLAFAHLARRELSAARVAFNVAAAILLQSGESSGDADLDAELRLAEGLLEFATGGWESSLTPLQEAVRAYAMLGEAARARAAARVLSEASVGRPLLTAPCPREIPSTRKPFRGPLSHVQAAWRVVSHSSLRAPLDPKETA